MQRISGGKEQVRVAGATIRQVVNNLDKEYPGIKDELCEDDDINPDIAVVIDDARLKRLKPALRVGQVDIDQLV